MGRLATPARRRRAKAGIPASLAALAALAACGGGAPQTTVAVPAPPPPIPAPDAGAEATVPGLLETEAFVLPEPGPAHRDEILASPMTRDPEFQREVSRWVEFWRTRARRSFPESLDRMSWFEEAVDSTLARKGLPRSLRYLPIIESGYHPGAVSRARAVGLWQFMAPTARIFGMGVSPLLDERRDPVKSTEAATEYLSQLRAQFGSWFMALAAYNAGPGRVQQVLNQHAPLWPPSDSLLWSLRRHLPAETRDYIPKFFAAALVAGDPEAHGYTAPERQVFAYDEVVVPDATTLDVVAAAAGTTLEEIQRLNPGLVRGVTPPGQETVLRVPQGRGESFRQAYELIPASERVTTVEHRVSAGETLSGIARRYGVALGELQEANPGVRARALRVGQRLLVPVAPRPGRTGASGR